MLINYTKREFPTYPGRIGHANPRYWRGETETGYRYFYADREDIREAYLAAGYTPIEEYLGLDQEEKQDAKTQEEETEEQEEKESVDIPEEWEDLSWPKLRSLASSLTDEPVKSKEQALEIIRAEID